MVRPGLFGTVRYGAYTVKYWITYTVDSLKMLVGGKVGVKDLSGPVGIVSAVDNVYQEAAPAGMVVVILNLLNIGVLLTANLGVMICYRFRRWTVDVLYSLSLRPFVEKEYRLRKKAWYILQDLCF